MEINAEIDWISLFFLGCIPGSAEEHSSHAFVFKNSWKYHNLVGDFLPGRFFLDIIERILELDHTNASTKPSVMHVSLSRAHPPRAIFAVKNFHGLEIIQPIKSTDGWKKRRWTCVIYPLLLMNTPVSRQKICLSMDHMNHKICQKDVQKWTWSWAHGINHIFYTST